MDYTQDNIEMVAETIVEYMSTTDLCRYVYEDLIHLMEHNEEMFDLNVEDLHMQNRTFYKNKKPI